ncbi:MAG: hypothetical protein HFI65_06915 [Lachnospiraceae bacterium]|nr:hypothetical protein [Lachnospiraceae bacterium]
MGNPSMRSRVLEGESRTECLTGILDMDAPMGIRPAPPARLQAMDGLRVWTDQLPMEDRITGRAARIRALSLAGCLRNIPIGRKRRKRAAARQR